MLLQAKQESLISFVLLHTNVSSIVYSQNTMYSVSDFFPYGDDKNELKIWCCQSETFLLKSKGGISTLVNRDKFAHLQ